MNETGYVLSSFVLSENELGERHETFLLTFPFIEKACGFPQFN